MKILMEGRQNNPVIFDDRDNSFVIPEKGKLYLNTTGAPRSGVVVRLPGELVLRHGWVNFEMDDEGYIVGIEIHAGDPFKGNEIQGMPWLNPKTPLKRE
jgi:hypothetical protein